MPALQRNSDLQVGATAGPAAGVRTLRRSFGRFPTGVTVVSYRDGDQVRGATVNSFTSVSIDPPLLLVALARSSRACAALAAIPFAVNVLRSDQFDVALQFAGRARPGLNIAWDPPAGPADPPTLSDAVAVFRCRPWRRYDGGDHVLLLGEITGFEQGTGDPLVFGDGRFISTGLPLLDGPLIYSLDGPPRPGWVGSAQRVHALLEQ